MGHLNSISGDATTNVERHIPMFALPSLLDKQWEGLVCQIKMWILTLMEQAVRKVQAVRDKTY
jgi:hypothetical protein